MKAATVRARVESKLKEESEEIFSSLGISMTEAIRMFLHQVKLKKGMPFPLVIEDEDLSDILHPSTKRMEALDLIEED